ncbi:BTAD domain-containing putative transcriptional regulator [Dactylosporangium sp. NPDC049742]|uniref:AfsR/SARP family transcriptional regulator n=1 Tax=Dactylosporangium sp. NPDC049742 TaxID=3154737 RepID=UPI0034373E23
MVRIGLLGGVRVTTDDGEPVDIGSAKTQTLLAALALSPGTPLPQARLVDLVWGDDPPRTAHKTLQWHVAQLRKGLGGPAIARVGDAYRLDVPPDAIDVARFRRHVGDGDPGGALTHWGGSPLAGLDAPGLSGAVAGLTEQWAAAVEADLERRAAADPRGVVPALTEFVEQHPLRERAWAVLMTALFRAGRQADALAAYRRARQHLVTELGVEPGPELRAAETQILAHDERLRGAASSTALFGRDQDLAATLDALTAAPPSPRPSPPAAPPRGSSPRRGSGSACPVSGSSPSAPSHRTPPCRCSTPGPRPPTAPTTRGPTRPRSRSCATGSTASPSPSSWPPPAPSATARRTSSPASTTTCAPPAPAAPAPRATAPCAPPSSGRSTCSPPPSRSCSSSCRSSPAGSTCRPRPP